MTATNRPTYIPAAIAPEVRAELAAYLTDARPRVVDPIVHAERLAAERELTIQTLQDELDDEGERWDELNAMMEDAMETLEWWRNLALTLGVVTLTLIPSLVIVFWQLVAAS